MLFAALHILASAFLPAIQANADDKLNEFEEQATRPAEPPARSRDDERQAEDEGVLLEDFLDLMVVMVSFGGVYSWDLARQRTTGVLLIPLVRLEFARHAVESDVTGSGAGLEVGYGPLAVWLNRTRFDEEVPDTTLSLSYCHGLYRASFGPRFEIDFGVGSATLEGAATNHGVSFSLPVRFHPSDYYGLEFRPLWSSIQNNTIQDLSLTLLAGWRYLHAKAGYRWLRTGGASLDGPYAGLVLSF